MWINEPKQCGERFESVKFCQCNEYNKSRTTQMYLVANLFFCKQIFIFLPTLDVWKHVVNVCLCFAIIIDRGWLPLTWTTFLLYIFVQFEIVACDCNKWGLCVHLKSAQLVYGHENWEYLSTHQTQFFNSKLISNHSVSEMVTFLFIYLLTFI